MTIEERKGDLAGLKIACLGDVTRNSAQDLMRAGCALSMQVMMAANPSQPSDYPENVPQALRDVCWRVLFDARPPPWISHYGWT